MNFLTTLRKKLLSHSGFSIVECVVAIGIFGIMAMILFTVLLNCVGQKGKNSDAAKGFDEQLENIMMKATSDGGNYMHSDGMKNEDFKIEFYKNGSLYVTVGGAMSTDNSAKLIYYDYEDPAKELRIVLPVLDIKGYTDWLAKNRTP